MLSVDLVCLLSPLLLPFLLATAGSPVSVFRPTGGSVTLEFQGHLQLEKEDVDLIQWYFGQEKIMKYAPLRDSNTIFTYQDRVEFNKETFSLELKNLQKNDSGLYSREIIARETYVVAEYRLSVLDPVESPVLPVVYNWTSCDSCNVTVTCKGRDLSLTSTCDCSTCCPEEEHSTDSTLTLSFEADVITCNHSNPVSWQIATMDIKALCSRTGQNQDLSLPGPVSSWIRIAGGALIVTLCSAALYWWVKRLERGVTEQFVPADSPSTADTNV
ncbi:CD48 antigen-like isoform X2 [Clupea harengus]|uniref:CD48 antigen-like isoform X2 n=1 Tax=Clupea harengus TaxID=7950 RepID=A0A6P8F4D9_CLUHA|nr:CD48 antigen-like isoform X2 [Clupea harengus]